MLISSQKESVSQNEEMAFDWKSIGLEDPNITEEPILEEKFEYEERKQVPIVFISVFVNLKMGSQNSSKLCNIEKPVTMHNLQDVIRREFQLKLNDVINSIRHGIVDIENDDECQIIEESSKLEVYATTMKIEEKINTTVEKIDVEVAQSNPQEWNTEQACGWLQRNNLNALVDIFRTNEINGQILLKLTEAEWKDMIASTVLRRKVINAVNLLKNKA